MRQNIIDSLIRLFSDNIDVLKVTFHTAGSHNAVKFAMHGHGIQEEDGLVTVYDDKDSQPMPKTVSIDPSMAEDVTYTDGRTDGMGIYEKSVVIGMKDGSWSEMATVGIG